ncbi:MAG: PaaI family thioesterase [Burkholderia sp.]|jgi:uncharacterized protein (TIGR00369 family)|nr:PaaI family thioesterase [Burkholderia sp.]
MTEIGRAHSGYADLLGYKMTGRAVDQAEVTLKVGPQHLNRASIPHGGLLATLLDSAAGFACAYAEDPEKPLAVVTLSINVMFIGQARLGDTLITRGKRIGGGKTIGYAEAEVTTQDGRAIARAEGVFKYIGRK